MSYAWLLPVGVLLGAFGTLIGAGGGFLLVPLLVLIYPRDSPETITSISLAVVLLNAISGTAAYARMGRVDYRSGIWFAAATVPGAILGALVTGSLPRRLFDACLGIVLTAIAVFLLASKRSPDALETRASRESQGVERVVVETDGTLHRYSYALGRGLALSVVVGFLSSLLGIGGGVLHVPGLVYLLGFPAHVAAATSHFVLVFMALAGTAVHVATGAFSHGVHRTVWLGVGVLVGAQIGARLSSHIRARSILDALAVGLALVGLRIFFEALG